MKKYTKKSPEEVRAVRVRVGKAYWKKLTPEQQEQKKQQLRAGRQRYEMLVKEALAKHSQGV
jgi:hypothetical protein